MKEELQEIKDWIDAVDIAFNKDSTLTKLVARIKKLEAALKDYEEVVDFVLSLDDRTKTEREIEILTYRRIRLMRKKHADLLESISK